MAFGVVPEAVRAEEEATLDAVPDADALVCGCYGVAETVPPRPPHSTACGGQRARCGPDQSNSGSSGFSRSNPGRASFQWPRVKSGTRTVPPRSRESSDSGTTADSEAES